MIVENVAVLIIHVLLTVSIVLIALAAAFYIFAGEQYGALFLRFAVISVLFTPPVVVVAFGIGFIRSGEYSMALACLIFLLLLSASALVKYIR